MKYQKMFLAVALVLTMACSSVVAATPTATATATPIPATPTNTPKPTSTPKPTATPNFIATQKYEDFTAIVERLHRKGYISTTAGDITELDPFKEDWAQKNSFNLWPYRDVDSDFVLITRLNWKSALKNPDESGCGVFFGGQENGDYYAVFLTTIRIRFLMKRGLNLYNVGKTNGYGAFSFDNPAEAEFLLAVSDQKAYVSVNGWPTIYTLSADQTAKGNFGFSLLSGTNKDYGTRCEATDTMLWTAK